MPRQSRLIVPGQPHHIIQRGNNKQEIFLTSKDYSYYSNKLHQASIEHDCQIHAYVLMTNHTHLLITPDTQQGIGKMMHKLGTTYVSYFNHNYKRTGTLLEGRYKSSIIADETYFLICMRYIELNPVRADMVKNPSDYKWSSYHSNALGNKDQLISPHSLYLSISKNDQERTALYQDLFNIVLSDKDIKRIQTATHKSIPLE